MANYTKLFHSILQSTVWMESTPTRILWITMLAMTDKNGEVQAAIPGLARTAGISIDEVKAGLQKFLDPDEYSRTKENEGRRIEEIDGGWRLLNHGKYRKLMSAEERREYERLKKQQYRAKKELSPSLSTKSTLSPDNSTLSTHTDTDTDTDTERQLPCSNPQKAADIEREKLEQIELIYKAYPRKVAREAALKAIKKALKKVAFQELKEAVEEFSRSPAGKNGQFTPHGSTWFNQERWKDDRAEWRKVNRGNSNGTPYAGFVSGNQDADIRSAIEGNSENAEARLSAESSSQNGTDSKVPY